MTAPSLERLVPDELDEAGTTGRATLALHVERYELAARHARGRVLDLACGAGYGTRLVADRAREVTEAVGVDIAEDAVAYARGRYARTGVRYELSDALAFRDAAGFDTAISLETVEHVREPGELIAHLVSLLRPGGVLVASVPTTPSVDVNPHHLHDFTERSLRALVAPHGLVEIDCLRQIQRFSPISALRREEARMADMRRGMVGYYMRHPGAAFRRLAATMRYGFTNRYATFVWRRPA
ncbi:MAG TPA: class I SAM-dependent methyltransferase [Kofleriaceae bacterium]|nr:class I SAM-dependent methyltransferase [Kofleriaceae bacterium]